MSDKSVIKLQKSRKPVLITAFLFVVLVSLGIWQLYRLQWKEALLEKRQAAITAPAVMLKNQKPEEIDSHYVMAKGHFIPGREFHLKPRTDNGRVGFHVIAAFRMDDGRLLFVNKGFADDASVAGMKRPKGPMTLGAIASIPHKSFFTPENNPAKNDWYWADLPAMAKAMGEDRVVPILLVDELTIPEIPNNHRQYAAFWFGMAFILLVVYYISRSPSPARGRGPG